MKIIKTNLKGLWIIKTKIFKDNRGFFKEVEKKSILKKKFIFDIIKMSGIVHVGVLYTTFLVLGSVLLLYPPEKTMRPVWAHFFFF